LVSCVWHPQGWKMEKRVLVKIKELQDKNPDMDVFFDGDQYAICGRVRKAPD
jgi:hypothetical protein